jgi:hypothetical protein
MAELNFIFSDHDQVLLIEKILESEAEIVPYLAYNQPKHNVITDVENFQQLLQCQNMYGPAFVTWKDTHRFPYAYDEVEKEGGKFYFLQQRYGGPYINLLPCHTIDDDGSDYITTGFVGYYTRYWIEGLTKEIPVSEELKRHYKEITAFIRKISKRIRAGSRIYWVGANALDQLNKGKAFSVGGLEL